jgi:PhnB protein
MTTKTASNATGPGVVPASPPLAPYLTVSDAKAAIAFYQRALGAQLLYRNDTPDGAKVIHASLQLPNGGQFMLCDDFPEMGGGKGTPQALGGTPVTLHIDCQDVDADWKRAMAGGAEEAMPLADQFWGDRYGIIRDPFGHRWSMSTRKRAVSRDEVEAASREHFPPK